MNEAYVVVHSALEPVVRHHFMVNRVEDWDDSGLVIMVIQHDTGGVFNLVIDELGVWLKRDADVG